MDKDLVDVINKAPKSTYKKIIIGLLIIVQSLAVVIVNSVYNRFTGLEKMDALQADEIENLQKDLAIMHVRLNNLQQQSDSIESFLIGRPELHGSIKTRG